MCQTIIIIHNLFSGSKNKNLIATPKQTPFSTPICSPAATPRNRSPQNVRLGSPRVDRKLNSPKYKIVDK